MSLVGTLGGHSCSVPCIDTIDTGIYYLLISADLSGHVVVWNLDTRKQLFSFDLLLLEKHELPQSIIHYIDNDMNVFVFIHLKTGRVLKYRLDMLTSPEAVMQFVEEKQVGSDTFMKLHRGPGGYCTAPSRSNPEGVDIVQMANWTRYVKDVKSKTMQTGACLCAKLLHLDTCGWLLLAGYDNGTVSVFHIDMEKINVKEMLSIQVFAETILCIDAVQFGDALHLVCGGPASEVKLVQLMSSEGFCKVSSIVHAPLGHAGAASVSMTDQLMVVGGWDTSLSVFTSDSLSEITRLGGHSDTVNQVQVVEFGRGLQSSVRPSLRYNELCITASSDGCIHMWNLSSCKIETIQ